MNNSKSKSGENLMPNNTELTIGLVEKAIAINGGRDNFKVGANLSIDHPETLRNMGLFQTMLLMAYQEGSKSTPPARLTAVNGMALMFGMLQASTSSKVLVQKMQDATGPFVNGLGELAPLVEKVTEVELALQAAAQLRDEGLPGIFQYEVTEELGAYVKELLDGTRDCLLDTAMAHLGNLAMTFMEGCSSDCTVATEYIAAIAGVLPEAWTASASS